MDKSTSSSSSSSSNNNNDSFIFSRPITPNPPWLEFSWIELSKSLTSSFPSSSSSSLSRNTTTTTTESSNNKPTTTTAEIPFARVKDDDTKYNKFIKTNSKTYSNDTLVISTDQYTTTTKHDEDDDNSSLLSDNYNDDGCTSLSTIIPKHNQDDIKVDLDDDKSILKYMIDWIRKQFESSTRLTMLLFFNYPTNSINSTISTNPPIIISSVDSKTTTTTTKQQQEEEEKEPVVLHDVVKLENGFMSSTFFGLFAPRIHSSDDKLTSTVKILSSSVIVGTGILVLLKASKYIVVKSILSIYV